MSTTETVVPGEVALYIEPTLESAPDFARLIRGTNGQQVLLQPMMSDDVIYLSITSMFTVNGEVMRVIVSRDDMDVEGVLARAKDGAEADDFLQLLRQAILDSFKENADGHEHGHVHGPNCHHG